MASKNYATIELYSNFPINSYANQYYNESEDTRDALFKKYCKHNKGVDYYEKMATVDLSNISFRLKTDYKSAMHFNYGCIEQEGKKYYFFINDIQWSSNLITATFYCTCDWWQTYCYDIQWKEYKSFIERETVGDDTFGKHIIDENLPISDYIINAHDENDIADIPTYVCLVLSDNTYAYEYSDTPTVKHLKLYYKYGIAYRLLTLAFPNTNEGKSALQKAIDQYVDNNKIDSIQGIYVAPVPIALNMDYTAMIYDKDEENHICNCYVVKDQPSITTHLMASKLDELDGFQPKNNKTKCYPYSFANITNYTGNSLVGKYEFAKNNTVDFAWGFPDVQGASGYGCLVNYDGMNGYNLDHSLNSIQNIELPWVSNTYSAYLSANINRINASYNIADRKYETTMKNLKTQKKVGTITRLGSGANNMITSTAKGFLGDGKEGALTSGLFSANDTGVGLLNHAVNMIGDSITTSRTANMKRENAYDNINATINDMKSKGDIAHGSFIPNMLTDLNKVGFQIQQMTVTNECAQMIDNYFSMFGYKVAKVDFVRLHQRTKWDYIKTASLNVTAKIPLVALNEIKDMFNDGTTLWHTLDGMYKYGDFRNPIR